MTVTRLKSLHPETEFGPSWNIPIYQSTWNDDKVGKIKKWLIQNEKTQKEINALLQKYSQETLKHLHKLKHDACYNEMLNLINFSKIRKK